MKKLLIFAMTAVLAVATSCSKDQLEGDYFSSKKNVVEAIIEDLDEHILTVGYEEEDETRFGVSEETLAGGSWSFFWEPGDAMGVYTDTGENNVRYVNTKSEKSSSATFAPDTVEVVGTPLYAYYPFNENGGEDYTAINGYLPSENTINKEMTTMPGMYRRGTLKTNTAAGSTFGFKHLFPSIRFQIDAAGTKLEGCRVKSIKITAKRLLLFSLPISGSFTFNAETLEYTTKSTSNTMIFNFEGYPTLESAMTFATCMLPIKKSDRFYFTVEAVGYTATFNVASGVATEANKAYTYALPLKNYSNLKIKTNNIEYVEPEEPTDPEDPEVPTDPVEPEQPETITGTFKAATYNIKSKSNGTIGTNITNDKWDFFGFSEDFNSYSTNLSGYKFGTRSRSTLSFWGSGPKDGLGFATRTETCSWSNEYIDEYDEEYGGLTEGANTAVDKGFRMYTVTMKDGVEVDVYITHMNTYDTEKHLACQHAQLKEVATYIANHQNGRPVIFMGDTNCRYTRHDFETYFWSIVRQAGLSYSDPWVEYQWAGVYPTYPSKSLMVSDATGTNSETDIICSTTQNGEVVDKVIYLNKTTNATQIKALNYLRDMDYSGLSDHMPIVVDFEYTKTLTK